MYHKINKLLERVGFTEVDDARFGQEILNILINLCNQFCTVLRYSLRGGQAGLEAIATRFVVRFAPLKLYIIM